MWKRSEYSKSDIEKAGRAIINTDIDAEERELALRVIDNWRAAHAFPLNTFTIRLKHITESIPNAVVAQRLKRLDSIVGKLEFNKTMSLFRMQDLGGCRAIVPSITQVYTVKEKFSSRDIRHELKKVNDYIQNPKASGYRGIHLIYSYMSDRNDIYNGLLIEVQIRTFLQHIWATAVETLGIFTNSALKASQGSEGLLRFLVVVSSIFAIEEDSPVVPNTSNDVALLCNEIKQLDRQYHIMEKLIAIKAAINATDPKLMRKSAYYLLVFDYVEHTVEISSFMKSKLDDAINAYSKVEEKIGESKIDAVLVSGASIDSIRKAYPNYFSDITEFVSRVSAMMLSSSTC